MADDRRQEAKRLYTDKGLTQAAIAAQLGVGRRTVERWAAEDGWSGMKKAKPSSNVVNISDRATTSAPAPVAGRSRRQREAIDELEIVESAIASLSLLLMGMNSSGEDRPVDTRGIGSTASAMVKLLEYRRKIAPPTVAALVELAIEFGYSPAEFMAELRKAWDLRAS